MEKVITPSSALVSGGPTHLLTFTSLPLFSSPAPPTIVATSGSLVAVEGSDLSLNCSATGDPLPTYHWIRLDTSLTDKAQGVDSPVLLVPDVGWNDAGLYACLVTNEQGRAQSEALFVTLQAESLRDAIDRGILVYHFVNMLAGLSEFVAMKPIS